MKIRLFLATVILCLVFGGLFASCGKDEKNKQNEIETAVGTYSEKDTSFESETDTLETMTSESEEVRIPVENQKALSFIEFQYSKALDAVSFARGHLEYDDNTEMISEDGYICYPIIETEAREELEGGVIDSFDRLSEYLRSIFARSISEDLIGVARETYVDVDGVFCLKTGRVAGESEPETQEESEETEALEEENESLHEEETEALIVSSTEFFLSKFTDKLFVYTAKVSFDGMEKVEYFDFIFENIGSGWYFTSFPALPQ